MIALAYLMKGDGEVSTEERAQLLAILNKHVSTREIQTEQLKDMVSAAFTSADLEPVETFANEVALQLSPGQKISIFSNLYDMALADGKMRFGEKRVLDNIRIAFAIEPKVANAIKEILEIKNDTTIFTNVKHSCNEPSYKLRVTYDSD
tara:strand:+ start:3203 stop:3649 length:447 start_codon:yes stop_codon:yes gene_type:complete